jgi:membrane glycosyltransferase
MAISPWICIVLIAMKRGDEALNASLLQLLSIVKCFIATIFFSALNASLPLLFMEKHSLMLHRR